MKKGFIFTIDAFYAMIFVVALAGAFAFYYNTAQTNSKQIETINMQTTDTALVAFYLGKTTADYPDFSATLAADANYAKCATLWNYSIEYPVIPEQSTIQSQLGLNPFCKRIR